MNVHAHRQKANYQTPNPSDIQKFSRCAISLTACGRGALGDRQYDLLGSRSEHDARLYAVGDLDLLKKKCVAIVGTRDVSDDGRSRARRLSRELVAHGIVVVSGLAKGVDTEAHKAAIENSGGTIAVMMGHRLQRPIRLKTPLFKNWFTADISALFSL